MRFLKMGTQDFYKSDSPIENETERTSIQKAGPTSLALWLSGSSSETVWQTPGLLVAEAFYRIELRGARSGHCPEDDSYD